MPLVSASDSGNGLFVDILEATGLEASADNLDPAPVSEVDAFVEKFRILARSRRSSSKDWSRVVRAVE
jgi:hypothetical protein